MSIHIPIDIEQLARLIAIKTGKTPEQIVREAVEARAAEAGVAQPKRKRTPEEIRASIDAIAARVAALPVLDTRSDDEILGYNEHGVPE
jgi:antitoxin VapB